MFKGFVALLLLCLAGVVLQHYLAHDFSKDLPPNFDAAHLRAILREQVYKAHRNGQNSVKLARSFAADVSDPEFIQEFAERGLELKISLSDLNDQVTITWHAVSKE